MASVPSRARSTYCKQSPFYANDTLPLTKCSLQAHISKVFLEDFALVSDSAYVAQVSLISIRW